MLMFTPRHNCRNVEGPPTTSRACSARQNRNWPRLHRSTRRTHSRRCVLRSFELSRSITRLPVPVLAIRIPCMSRHATLAPPPALRITLLCPQATPGAPAGRGNASGALKRESASATTLCFLGKWAAVSFQPRSARRHAISRPTLLMDARGDLQSSAFRNDARLSPPDDDDAVRRDCG